MNLSLLFHPHRSCLLALLLLVGARTAWAQASNGAYKPLVTATNLAVHDTLSGVDLNVTVIDNANHGNVTKTFLGSSAGNVKSYRITYTPNSGYIGRDTFLLELNYTQSFPFLVYQAFEASVYPSILTAKPDFAVTSVNTPVTIPVLSNDSGSNPPLSVSAIPLVNHGTASVSPAGVVTFTPATGYTGVAHLNYVVCDALGNCKTVAVNIGVNSGPPVNDSLRISTAKNTPVSMPLLYGGYSLHQAPANGTVTIQGGQAFRYVPQFNFSGTNVFVLKTVAAGDTAFKTVVVDVLNTPSPNRMALEDFVFTPKDQSVIFNVRDNDIGNLPVKGVILPANLPGTLNYWQGNGQMKFTPQAGFSGVVRFQYFIGNSSANNIETATINVMVGNMNPAQGVFDLVTPMETPLVINYNIPFLGYDFSVLDAPDNGDLELLLGFNTVVINGQSISGYNLLLYTPYSGYSGPDEFELNYCMTQTNQCQSVKVAVDVTEISSGSAPFCVDDCVWAGDINYDGIVNNKDILPLGYFMGIEGDERNGASLEWYGQYGDNWANPFTGYPIDLKHADTDGDGDISTTDTTAIGLFYGKTHNIVPSVLSGSKGLPFYFKVLTAPNPGVGDLVQVEVSLGKNSNPATNIYGFTLDLSLSPQIVDSAFQMTYFDNSWLNMNSPSLHFQKRPRVGRLETAFTRTNGVSASGKGIIGKFEFIVVDDAIDGSRPDPDTYNLAIQLEGGEVLYGDGSRGQVEPMTLTLPLNLRKNAEPATAVAQNDLFIYPSPARDLVQVHLNGNNQIRRFSILDLTGRPVWTSGDVQWKHAELPVSELPSGVYFGVAETDAGRITKKFEVIR